MPSPQFIPLSLDEFRTLVARYDFSARTIDAVHMHHTWRPRQRDFRGLASILAMWKYHTEVNRWSDIAQHVTIDPEGIIWTGRSWRQPPASCGGHNGTSRRGPFMFEIIGDFDTGRETLQGKQREAVIGVITAIQKRNALAPESLRFHRQLGSPKTCPGNGITYESFLAEVRAAHALGAAPPGGRGAGAARAAKGKKAADGERAAPPTPVFVVDETRIHAALNVLGAATRAVDDGDAGMDEVEEGMALDLAVARDVGMVERPAGSRDAKPDLDAPALARLRPHVVNLVQGEFVPTGIYQTTKADVDAIFDVQQNDQLARRLQAATPDKPLHLMLWAHGGLVSEKSGLRGAARAVDWWMANGVYPIHFVWETGLMESVGQLLRGAKSRAPAVAARDLWDYTTDPLVERLSRPLGAPLWSGMKRSAERASAPDGGARYVAEHVAQLVKTHGKKVRVHAAGHSAGSIFHAHLVPVLLQLGVTLESLHFLAPAVRLDTFLHQLKGAVTDRKQVGQFAMFTMTRDWEKRDNCKQVYRKSLLYLVSLAFEPQGKTPILGLEEFVRDSAHCQEIFGLAGKAATGGEVIWSRSVAQMGRHASRATAHGDFDEDQATMNALVRRVLGKDDVEPIVEFVGDASRGMDDEEELPADLALFLRPMAAAAGGSEPGVDAEEAEDTIVASAPAPRPPSRPTPAPAPNGGRRLALCIGIDDYNERPLEGCVADARLWAQVLKKHWGFPKPQLLLNEKATQRGITDAIRALVERSRSGDLLVLQYSGHGTNLPDVDGDEEDDGQDEALCPIDYEAGNFVIDDDLKEIFAEIPSGVNLTCFFDCCHSGTITRLAVRRGARAVGVHGGAARARYLPVSTTIRARYEKVRSAADGTRSLGSRARALAGGAMHEVVFSACRADQVAYESDGHGDFTRIMTALLEGGRDLGTHADLHERLLRDFGTDARQQPQLDCAPAMLEAPFLAPRPTEA